MVAQMLLLAVPLITRELVHYRCTRSPDTASPLGGTSSAVIWNIVYVMVLALAGYSALVTTPTTIDWIGYAVLWAGALLRVVSYIHLGRFYAIRIIVKEGHRVIDEGPYRFLRHPLHLGLVIEMTGLALVSGNWLAAPLLCIALITLIARNLNEEGILVTELGKDYVRYRKRSWDVIDLIPHRHRS